MLPLLLLLLPTKKNGNNNIFYFKLYVITGPEDAYKSFRSDCGGGQISSIFNGRFTG